VLPDDPEVADLDAAGRPLVDLPPTARSTRACGRRRDDPPRPSERRPPVLIIGENIHIIAPPREGGHRGARRRLIQAWRVRQVEAGAGVVDLNIGPQKKLGHEVMPWIVEAVQEVTDVPLSLDTTNLAAMEAGLKVCKQPAMLNSASADPARLDSVMQLAGEVRRRVIALTMGVDGIPTTADGRAGIAMEALLPAAEAAGVPVEDVYLDPLVLTVTCNQDVARESVEAIRMFKMLADPPPTTVVGLSNISNGCPPENRPLINRTFLVMLMGAGLDSAIADPSRRAPRTSGSASSSSATTATPLGGLVVALYDAVAAMEELDPGSSTRATRSRWPRSSTRPTACSATRSSTPTRTCGSDSWGVPCLVCRRQPQRCLQLRGPACGGRPW
jgi:5-methyltetrahydrofolate corrinoid/iron sulfur protein methyltransferase